MAPGTVRIYERPHPLLTRRIVVPAAIAVLVAIAGGLLFLLR